jgi:hypothetical protein
MSELDRQVGGNHYKKWPLEPMLVAVVNNMPWAEGEIVKYVVRWRDKNGLKDLKKAHHILGFIIEFHEGKLDLMALSEAIAQAMFAKSEDVSPEDSVYAIWPPVAETVATMAATIAGHTCPECGARSRVHAPGCAHG